MTSVPGADAPFVPNGASRRETAILLVGTAEEHGIDQRSIRATPSGFFVSEELADILWGDDAGGALAPEDSDQYEPYEPEDVYTPADYSVAQVKEFVTANPDQLDAVLLSEQAGQNRSTLVEWLVNQQTSGNRAEKNTDTEE